MPDPQQIEAGNIDLSNRPRVRNPDGSISTVRSIGIEDNGVNVVIPTVSQDGRVLSNADAVALYRKTGQHLGKFTTQAEADAFARQLHESEARKLMPDPQQVAAPPQSITFDTPASVSFDNAATKPPERSWLDSVKDYFDEATQGVRSIIPGTPQATALGTSMLHPIDTAKAYSHSVTDIADKAKDAFDKGDYATGVRHALNYLLTGAVGPVAVRSDQAGDLAQQGQTARSLGAATDVGLQVAAPVVASKVAPALAAVKTEPSSVPPAVKALPDLMKAAPPSRSTPYTPDDVIRAAPEIAAQLAKKPVEDMAGAVEATDLAAKNIQSKVKDLAAAHPNYTSVPSVLPAVRAQFSKGGAMGTADTDLPNALKTLAPFNLDQPMTLAEKMSVLTRMNALNEGVLSDKGWDTTTALNSDPKFAARYVAANALRDDIYNGLDSLGVPGVRQLQQRQASVIKLRDAMAAQQYKGDKTVSGTGANTIPAKIARGAIPAVGGAAGAYFGGVPGAAAGTVVGNEVARSIVPQNLTRDALVTRALKTLGLSMPPTYPEVPATVQPRGLLTAPATPLGSGPDMSGTGGLYPAKMVMVKDPVTGELKRVYTSEVAGGGSQ